MNRKTMQQRAKERGLKLVEAAKPLILCVNSKDVKLATKKQADECAFARACKRKHPDVERVYFFRTTAYIQTKTKLTRYTLPPSMQKEIVAFDRGGSFEPGNYRLSPVAKGNTLDALRKRPRSEGRERSNRRSPRAHATTNVRATFNVLS